MRIRRLVSAGAALLSVALLAAGTAVAQPKTDLLYEESDGADAAAIARLGEMFTAAGGAWQQTPISGDTADVVAKLRADVAAGHAPPAVQLKGAEIAEWNATGLTASMDALADAEGWDRVVAPALAEAMKPKGSWVAVPLDIHRANWMWASTRALTAAGIAAMPKTWAEFNADCEKLVAARLICIAHGNTDRADAAMFDAVVYGMDIDLYRRAFARADLAALRGPGMAKAFGQFRKMIGWMDPGMSGRAWDAALAMITAGKAGFLFMGDRTTGTLNARGFKQGSDYLCAQAPVDWGKTGYILSADSVAFFKQKDKDYVDGQQLLAKIVMSPRFQSMFSQATGSIPARLDVDLSSGFNPCQQSSLKDLQTSIASGTLVRSMAHGMIVPQKYRGAMMEVIAEFVSTAGMSAEAAAKALGDAVAAQM